MISPEAADAPESDDWNAWRAYAEALAEADDPRGAAILTEADGADYREVERQWGLDGLRDDGSWHFTWARGFIDRARFRLAPETAPQRRELVERFAAGADVDDPERWESVLIEALLSHPAAARLRGLELHLTDVHHSARRAAEALAARRRERLTDLRFGYGFTYLYEDVRTSTGGRVDPMDHYDAGFVGDATDALWRALPALRTLAVEGALLFHWIAGDALTDLRLRGAVLSDGAVFPGSRPGTVTLPNLAALTLEIGTDVHGTACPVEQLDELDAAGYPALRSLDLGAAEFDASDDDVLAALAASSVLPQLERLRVRSLDVEDAAELAPRFAHLDLSAAGPVSDDAADVLPIVPWTR
ncbi:hypothetical protein [Actinomadura parmotrematis]|uniref:Leucine-rich repeat domain-containing protein n=1 Tax=Actinomadura parmotrematis TaxID=2864039 RepID=A0ABS7FZ97_9ACTN|nr:hypothetical protein [Actinomadura parmotrematis]MBW8485773.1 hypothetical protein [Actinomadura parmotrematis]